MEMITRPRSKLHIIAHLLLAPRLSIASPIEYAITIGLNIIPASHNNARTKASGIPIKKIVNRKHTNGVTKNIKSPQPRQANAFILSCLDTPTSNDPNSNTLTILNSKNEINQ